MIHGGIPAWLVVVLAALVMMTVAEIGFRAGLRLHAKNDAARKAQIAGIQTGTLNLIGLLLGFTFAMSVSRYEVRRQLVIREARAIRNAHMRASVLPAPHPPAVRDLLKRYLTNRIRAQEVVEDPRALAAAIAESYALQAQLWQHTDASIKQVPTVVTVSFAAALTEMLDTGTERLAAGRADIPLGVWMLLLIVVACGNFITGYNGGAQGARSMLSAVFYPLVVATVILLVYDLSHPLRGTIGISQQPMLELQQTLR
jgi:hypothetical protein